ncbi:MAG TPA: hypothetical protein DCE55_04540 [Planctomycetaceae bacterium]|nr:hypothetical protein [Planctomycetaceae bacterium]
MSSFFGPYEAEPSSPTVDFECRPPTCGRRVGAKTELVPHSFNIGTTVAASQNDHWQWRHAKVGLEHSPPLRPRASARREETTLRSATASGDCVTSLGRSLLKVHPLNGVH